VRGDNPTSVNAIAQQAEKRRQDAIIREARTTTVTIAEAKDSLKQQIQGKAWWIMSFSDGPKKRPDTEIERKKLELAVLVQIEGRLVEKKAEPDAAE
jgi:hypothetical protein